MSPCPRKTAACGLLVELNWSWERTTITEGSLSLRIAPSTCASFLICPSPMFIRTSLFFLSVLYILQSSFGDDLFVNNEINSKSNIFNLEDSSSLLTNDEDIFQQSDETPLSNSLLSWSPADDLSTLNLEPLVIADVSCSSDLGSTVNKRKRQACADHPIKGSGHSQSSIASPEDIEKELAQAIPKGYVLAPTQGSDAENGCVPSAFFTSQYLVCDSGRKEDVVYYPLMNSWTLYNCERRMFESSYRRYF